MKRWKAILSLLCLAIWLPATQHCQLERLPGLGFLHCPTDTPGNSDCQGDSCDTVERGLYKTPDNADAGITPPTLPVLVYMAPATETAIVIVSRPAAASAASVASDPEAGKPIRLLPFRFAVLPCLPDRPRERTSF